MGSNREATSLDLLHEFQRFSEDFRAANLRFPDIHYAILQGTAVEHDDGLRKYIADAIAGGLPLDGPSSITPPYRYFYGSSLCAEGLLILRSLAGDLISLAVKRYGAVALRNPTEAEQKQGRGVMNDGFMPVHGHSVFEGDDVEHDWMQWVIQLGRTSNHPCLSVREGPLRPWRKPAARKPRAGDCPAGDYLFLPDGRPLGRWHDGEGNLHEDREFRRIQKAVQSGSLGEVTILDHSVFLASAVSVDALVERIRRHSPALAGAGGEAPGAPGGFTPGQLAAMVKLSTDRLRHYVKRAGLERRPARGGKDFIYTRRDAATILAVIANEAGTEARQAARRALDGLGGNRH